MKGTWIVEGGWGVKMSSIGILKKKEGKKRKVGDRKKAIEDVNNMGLFMVIPISRIYWAKIITLNTSFI